MSQPSQINLMEIERQARQMQAEVIANGLRIAARWIASFFVRPTVKTPA